MFEPSAHSKPVTPLFAHGSDLSQLVSPAPEVTDKGSLLTDERVNPSSQPTRLSVRGLQDHASSVNQAFERTGALWSRLRDAGLAAFRRLSGPHPGEECFTLT